MEIKPYLIVPKLIPQPTWGGSYIASFKNRRDEKLAMKIGQSYELSSETMLTTLTDSDALPVEIGDPSTGKTVDVVGDQSRMFPLQSLIEQNPSDVLGERYVDSQGTQMNILIKFTQAKGNSFQVHVRPGHEIGHWKAKPESWYFFEPGKATLGLKNTDPQSIERYKTTCKEILDVMQSLSKELSEGKKTPGQAKVDAAAFISSHSPFDFVNEVAVPEEAIVDLAQGGIHHSWEEGETIPEGNIIYEVQLNVMDNDCTLRSFDKGKISDDGKIRPIHIDDYFQALDTDPEKNNPNNLVRIGSDSLVFDTPYYKMKKAETLSAIDGSFQHVFVKEGAIQIGEIIVRKGASLFIPRSYQFESSSKATVLTTYF